MQSNGFTGAITKAGLTKMELANNRIRLRHFVSGKPADLYNGTTMIGCVQCILYQVKQKTCSKIQSLIGYLLYTWATPKN